MSRPIDWSKVGTLDEETVARYRAMTPAQKVELVNELNRAARKQAADRIRVENPDWSDEQIQAEVARKMLNGEEEHFLE